MALRKFTPLMFENRLLMWIDAADQGTVSLSSGKVASIRDKSRYGRNMTQANSAFQPEYDQFRMNGLPTISFFGGASTRLRNTSLKQVQPYTIAMAMVSTVAQTGMMLVASANTQDGGVDASATALNTFYSFPSPQLLNMFAGSGFTNAIGNIDPGLETTKHRMICQFNGAASNYSVNGAQVVASPGARPISGIELGSWNDGGNSATYLFGELLVLSGTLNAQDFLRIDRYLLGKWRADGSTNPESTP